MPRAEGSGQRVKTAGLRSPGGPVGADVSGSDLLDILEVRDGRLKKPIFTKGCCSGANCHLVDARGAHSLVTKS